MQYLIFKIQRYNLFQCYTMLVVRLDDLALNTLLPSLFVSVYGFHYFFKTIQTYINVFNDFVGQNIRSGKWSKCIGFFLSEWLMLLR
jgi:hypothetical protein